MKERRCVAGPEACALALTLFFCRLSDKSVRQKKKKHVAKRPKRQLSKQLKKSELVLKLWKQSDDARKKKPSNSVDWQRKKQPQKLRPKPSRGEPDFGVVVSSLRGHLSFSFIRAEEEKERLEEIRRKQEVGVFVCLVLYLHLF